MLWLAVIGWKKKQFRKYFDKEENFTLFHQHAHRLLEAPTIPITRLLQDAIHNWLTEIKEARAAQWWIENWMYEYGNYTNATAGYLGTNKSAGLESGWKYLRRDTVGGAGSTKRISMNVFVPSLKQYIGDLSKRHASKILCKKTGAHRFPNVPVISTSLWGKVQEFRLVRLLLSVSAGSANTNKQWQNELKFFDEQPLGAAFSDLIPKYRAAKHPKIARSILAAGIVMPTERLMTKMTRKGFQDFAELEAGIEDMRTQYRTLINDTENFMIEYPTMGVEDILDVMESFDSIAPLPVKYGEIVFLCNCKGAYHSYARASKAQYFLACSIRNWRFQILPG